MRTEEFVLLEMSLDCLPNLLLFKSRTSLSLLCINQFQQCPSPPGATAGHLLMLSVPGMGHSQFYRGPSRLGISIPRGDPQAFDTHVFKKTDKFIGKDEAFVKGWLVHQGLEKLVDVFKGMFSQYF